MFVKKLSLSIGIIAYLILKNERIRSLMILK